MRRFIVPLMVIGVVVALVFAGCATPAPTEPTTPSTPTTPTTPSTPTEPTTPSEPTPAPSGKWQSIINGEQVPVNLYEGLAVKPDGSPYNFASCYIITANEFMQMAQGYFRSLVTRAGGTYIEGDAGGDIQMQIEFMEDMIATEHPDGFLTHACNETMICPTLQKMRAAGIPIVLDYTEVECDDYDALVSDFPYKSPGGSDCFGDYFIERAEAENEQYKIYEIWISRGSKMSHDRHEGFFNAVKNNPLIEVVETPGDINFSDEIAAEMVIEAFSADPSLNAIYAQGVGQMGAVAGLRTIGRLVPFDNPDHVVMAVYDSETTVLDLMLEEEVVDCMGSLSPLQIYDLNIKALFTLAIEGNPVTKNINYDLRTITSENAHTEKMFGALLAWPLAYPMDDWDKWPILDTTEVSLPTPTILEGY